MFHPNTLLLVTPQPWTGIAGSIWSNNFPIIAYRALSITLKSVAPNIITEESSWPSRLERYAERDLANWYIWRYRDNEGVAVEHSEAFWVRKNRYVEVIREESDVHNAVRRVLCENSWCCAALISNKNVAGCTCSEVLDVGAAL